MNKTFNLIGWEHFADQYIGEVAKIKASLDIMEELKDDLDNCRVFDFTPEIIINGAKEGYPHVQLDGDGEVASYIADLNKAALNLLNNTNKLLTIMDLPKPAYPDPEENDYDDNF